MKTLATLLVAVAWLAFGTGAEAHEIRPALVQITQRDAHHYDILWKQPVNGEIAVHLVPRLSGGALDSEPSLATVTPAFALKLWRNVSDEIQPLDGQILSIEGLERTITDVLVNVTLSDGRSVQQLLKPQLTSIRLALNVGNSSPPAAAYLSLGIEHILTGADHLLFVFGLLLLVGRNWALLKTITAFTIAHSVTLAATALGWLHVQSSLVEALVALSIVVLAVELTQRSRPFGTKLTGRTEMTIAGSASLDGHRSHAPPEAADGSPDFAAGIGDVGGARVGVTSRYPWLIAFLFGLLHGCAFAGALSEVGLPQEHIPVALFLFNVGVEIGQLLFIAAASALLWPLGRWINTGPAWANTVPAWADTGPAWDNTGPAWANTGPPWANPRFGWAKTGPALVNRAVHYAIGVYSSYWFIERFLIAIGHSA